MKLLALETSSNACSVALANGSDVLERHVIEPRAHTRILMPMIRELLAEAGFGSNDLDAIILGNGPGSFIGMRIGASVAQGIAYAAGLNILPLSSLAAIAAEVMAGSDARYVAVTQDARMHEVYSGFFERGTGGLPMAIGQETIQSVAGIVLPENDGSPWSAAGDGWRVIEQSGHSPGKLLMCEVRVPRARYLVEISRPLLGTDALIAPELLEPAYLRHTVATPPKSS